MSEYDDRLSLGSRMQSCRDEEGITVGLVDAMIGIVRVLSQRDLSPFNVQEALADLTEDGDFKTILDRRRTNPREQS